MEIKFLGAHNTESRNTKLASLLIDDILALDAGGLTSSLSFAQQLKLSAVLLTHQHYDHIKDIPLLGMNFYLHNTSIGVYSIEDVHETVRKYLLNGDLYPKFLEEVEGGAAIKFHIVKPYQEFKIEGYSILPLPVTHVVPAVGYQITSADAKMVFYAGDTGPRLADCWKHISPRLIITEVTAPNRFEQFGREKGHLTPGLLKEELLDFQKAKGYLSDVIAVHMNPSLESEIETELATIAGELGNSIKLAYEGMKIEL
jgi:ribonuclease BN (tRNA processing enzyme)